MWPACITLLMLLGSTEVPNLHAATLPRRALKQLRGGFSTGFDYGDYGGLWPVGGQLPRSAGGVIPGVVPPGISGRGFYRSRSRVGGFYGRRLQQDYSSGGSGGGGGADYGGIEGATSLDTARENLIGERLNNFYGAGSRGSRGG